MEQLLTSIVQTAEGSLGPAYFSPVGQNRWVLFLDRPLWRPARREREGKGKNRTRAPKDGKSTSSPSGKAIRNNPNCIPLRWGGRRATLKSRFHTLKFGSPLLFCLSVCPTPLPTPPFPLRPLDDCRGPDEVVSARLGRVWPDLLTKMFLFFVRRICANVGAPSELQGLPASSINDLKLIFWPRKTIKVQTPSPPP